MAFTFTQNGTTTTPTAETSLQFKQLAETYLNEFNQYGASYVQQKVRACLDGNSVKLLEVVEEKVAELHAQVVTLQAVQPEHTALQEKYTALHMGHTALQEKHTALHMEHTALHMEHTEQKARVTKLEAERETDRAAQVQAWNEMNLTLQAWKQKREEMEQYIKQLESKVSTLGEELHNEKQYYIFRNRRQ